MNILYRCLLVTAAVAALLLGVQAPNFVDQYEMRLDVHLSEAGANLHGYQEIADRFFNGSLAALLAKHEQSTDPVFRAEAKPLRELFGRYRHFSEEQQALNTALPGKLLFIATRADRALTAETWAAYSVALPLNAMALTIGLIAMALVVLVIELLRLMLRRLGALFTLAETPSTQK